MVEIDSHDVGAFRSWRPHEFREVVDMLLAAKARVARGEMAAARYDEIEQMVGLRLHPEGLLASAALSPHVHPVEIARYDWVHNMLQEGVFTIEVQAFVKVAGLPRSNLRDMLRDPAWAFPGSKTSKARQLHRIFDDRRVSSEKPDRIKASCSEWLGVYGILRHFVECHVPDVADTRPHRQSFLAACEVLDLLLQAKHAFAELSAAAEALQNATSRFLRLHKAAYGTRLIKPKHHWQMDVPPQMVRDGLLLDAFVIERTHLEVKAVASHVRNTNRYEASTLASLANVAFQKAGAMSTDNCLLGVVGPLEGCPDTTVADRMEVFGVEMRLGDVVLRGDAVAMIAGCALSGGNLFAFVQPARVVRRLAPHSLECRLTAGLEAWPANAVRLSLAWRQQSDSLVVLRE